MTQEELQKYWDASLIHAWRRFISVKGAMSQFTKGTGMMLHECDLLRVPPKGLPWTVDRGHTIFRCNLPAEDQRKAFQLRPGARHHASAAPAVVKVRHQGSEIVSRSGAGSRGVKVQG